MEMERFDAMARRVGAAEASRRQAIRGLAGSALAALATGFGFEEETTATPRVGRSDRGRLAAEGKRKGKKHGKRKGKGTPKPEPCDDGRPRCPDGSCAPIGQCCPEDPAPVCEQWETATCCRGERVCALPQATCEWASWLVYDEETCDCACPAGTVPGPGQFEIICCPESHPTHGNNYHCFGGPQPWVCAIGYIPHPTIPDVCCREDACGPAAAVDGAGERGQRARTLRNQAPAGRGR